MRDLGSRNGSYLNEVLMEEEMLLQPGDRLRIGPIVFQVPGAKTDFAVATGTPEPPASDDDIASWLSSEGLKTSDGRTPGSGDTTIIPKMPADEPEPEAEVPVAAKHAHAMDAAPAPPQPQRQFRNVAEEAADIIRRHWQLVKAEEEEE